MATKVSRDVKRRNLFFYYFLVLSRNYTVLVLYLQTTGAAYLINEGSHPTIRSEIRDGKRRRRKFYKNHRGEVHQFSRIGWLLIKNSIKRC